MGYNRTIKKAGTAMIWTAGPGYIKTTRKSSRISMDRSGYFFLSKMKAISKVTISWRKSSMTSSA